MAKRWIHSIVSTMALVFDTPNPPKYTTPTGCLPTLTPILLSFLSVVSEDGSLFFEHGRRDRPAYKPRDRTKSWGQRSKQVPRLTALLLINDVDLVLATDNRLYRASASAIHSGRAHFQVELVRDCFTNSPVYLNTSEETVVVNSSSHFALTYV